MKKKTGLNGCVYDFSVYYRASNKVCVPNKTEDLNLSIFRMITGKN